MQSKKTFRNINCMHLKSARNVLLVLLMLVGAFYVYTTYLPAWFSRQNEVTFDLLQQGGYYDRGEETGVYEGQSVVSYEIPESQNLAMVLAENTGVDKRVEVDLTNQKVYAFEGSNKVFEFIVSTGKWGRTPTGVFSIQYKTRAQKMSGGNRAINTYYYLPNVPFVQFFGNSEIPWSRGFSLHGTYWHDKFGTPQSHGCINMKTADAETLYYWTSPSVTGKGVVKVTNANEGTPVIIYGTTPVG